LSLKDRVADRRFGDGWNVLSARFTEVGRLRPKRFRDVATSWILDYQAQRLRAMEMLLDTDGSAAPHMRHEVTELRRQLFASVIDPMFVCPVECHDRGSITLANSCRRSLSESPGGRLHGLADKRTSNVV